MKILRKVVKFSAVSFALTFVIYILVFLEIVNPGILLSPFRNASAYVERQITFYDVTYMVKSDSYLKNCKVTYKSDDEMLVEYFSGKQWEKNVKKIKWEKVYIKAEPKSKAKIETEIKISGKTAAKSQSGRNNYSISEAKVR